MPREDFATRSYGVHPTSLDVGSRSVTAVVASETPVLKPDWAREEMVPEILLMSGFIGANKVPLLNSHSRWSTDDVLGSVDGIRVENDQLIGTVTFSETADRAFRLVSEGHLTDVSIGYQIKERTYVPKGETLVIRERPFRGPANVVTRWAVKEVSVTPIGADVTAKFRELEEPIFGGRAMSKILREWLEARGLPKDLDDEAVRAWLVERGMPSETEDVASWCDANTTVFTARKKGPDFESENRSSDQSPPIPPQRDLGRLVQQEIRRAIDDSRKLDAFVRQQCAAVGLSESFEEIRAAAIDESSAMRSILERMAARQPNLGPSGRIEGGPEGIEKLRAAASTSLQIRALRTKYDDAAIDRLFPVSERSPHANEFRHSGLQQIAEACLRAEGIDPSRLTPQEMGAAAMGFRSSFGTRGGYHTTGSFPNIMMDVVNKTLLAGFSEYPATWRTVGRQGESTKDFKTIRRMRLSDAPNLDVWTGNGPHNQVAFRDEKETYAVESYSAEVSFDWKSIVNDDMSALSRIPQQLGVAANRTVNAAFWAQILSNPTMQDGQALFLETPTGNRFRSNYVTGSATPTTATLQTMKNLMLQMRGANRPGVGSTQVESESILGLTPKYLVGPGALSTTIEQLVFSAYDPVASQFQVYNPSRVLVPVIEPLLDANSATAFYLFADPSQIDTVEVTFLQGQETPVTLSGRDEKQLSIWYVVIQSFAAKAIDFRGIIKHKGAA